MQSAFDSDRAVSLAGMLLRISSIEPRAGTDRPAAMHVFSAVSFQPSLCPVQIDVTWSRGFLVYVVVSVTKNQVWLVLPPISVLEPPASNTCFLSKV